MVARWRNVAHSPADVVRRVHQPVVLCQDARGPDHRARVSRIISLVSSIPSELPQLLSSVTHDSPGVREGPVKILRNFLQ